MLGTFKRFFLLSLLALTGYAAVIIAWAVFRTGRGPETLSPAIEGTMVQGFLLLISFAGYTALNRPFFRIIAFVGLQAAALMQILTPLFVARCVLHLRALGDDPRVAFIQTGLMTAGLLCLVPFVLVPRMKRVGQIVQWTTVVYLTVAYIITTMQVLSLRHARVDEAVVTLLIPAGACMMGVFAVHLYLAVRREEPYTSVSPVIYVRCPRCHTEQLLGIGESRCGQCKLRIAITVEEPSCPNCRYNLHGLTAPVCPECGQHLSADDVAGRTLSASDLAGPPAKAGKGRA